MSEPKAQLVDPQENMNLPGMNATGVITASSFSGEGGVVTGLTGSPNLNVGVVTATSFVGDGTGHAANLTGTPNLNLGLTTATSFVGDAVGKAAGLTGTPNLNVGLVTATGFAGNVTGDVTGNITGLAVSVTPGVNLNVGVATGIQWHGNGGNLTGAGSSAYIAQEITATGGETIIDLSDGNVIYYKGEANTTVGFASTSAAEQITFIRDTNPNYDISLSTGGVDFDGDDALTADTSSDYSLGTGDYTIEFWFNADAISDDPLFENRGSGSPGDATGFTLTAHGAGAGTNGVRIWWSGSSRINGGGASLSTGAWFHLAATRSSGTTYLFLDGTLLGTTTDAIDVTTTEAHIAGGKYDGGSGISHYFDGKISNFRMIKGTCLYTTNFVPPSAALTNVTNTKLLCCQSDSSATAATVIATGSITATGNPTAGAQTITKSGSLSATITWPSTVIWNDNLPPTLVSNDYSGAFQIFHFTTGDTGASYQAWEEMKNSNLSANFRLFSWGHNQQGELGLNTRDDHRSSPIQLPGNWSRLSSNNGDGANQGAIKTDGTLWMSGTKGVGQLGQNSAVTYSSPVQVGTDTTWCRVSVGSAVIAAKTNGTLWSWGSGAYGGLGQNSYTKLSSPTQIGSGTDWSTAEYGIAGGHANGSALKTNGTLWVWGRNFYGELGQNNRTQQPSPIQIPGSWASAQASVEYTTFRVTSTGQLWAIGKNGNGQLGLNDKTTRSSPTQVGTDTTWGAQNPKTGAYTSLIIKTDGTLWGWGANGSGQLGQNNTTEYSSPRQVGTDTTWNEVTIGTDGSILSTKTDSTAWVWGMNYAGVSGINNNVKYSSPVQLPGTDWVKITTIGAAAFGLKSS